MFIVDGISILQDGRQDLLDGLDGACGLANEFGGTVIMGIVLFFLIRRFGLLIYKLEKINLFDTRLHILQEGLQALTQR
jgi:hypothetical protein